MTHFCQERNAEGIGEQIEDVSIPQIMETRGVDSGCAVPQTTFLSGADHATRVPFPQNVSILEEPAEAVNLIPQEWVQ